MHKVVLRTVFLAAILNSIAAQASDYAGSYFGAKFGVNKSSASGTVTAPSQSTFAYGVQGGYLEAGYNWDIKAITVGLGTYYDYNSYEKRTNDPQFTSWAYGINTKLGLPIDDWLLYAKYGYGYSTGTRDLSAVNQRSSNVAIGVEYELVYRWGAVVEYKTDDFSNRDGSIKISNKTFAFGLIYYFDRPDAVKEQAPAPDVELQPEPYTEVDLGLDAEPPPDIGASITTGTVFASDPESWQDLLENKTVIIEGTIFAAGTTVRLRSEYIKELEDIVGFARKFPDAKFELVGYSDNVGATDYNQRLSLQQAETVKNYLIVKGVAADRISAKGKGSADPIGDNNTPEGRAKNRRIEITAIIKNQNIMAAAATAPKPASVPASKSTSVPVVLPAPVPVTVPVPVTASKPEPVSPVDSEFWNDFMEVKPFNVTGESFISSTVPSLKKGDNKELDEIAGLAGKYPDTNLELVGYSDSMGSDEYNHKVSLARAKSVKKYLVKKGVASDRITARGEGSANPVGDNKTKAGRARNRRVEILPVVKVQEISSLAASVAIPAATTVPATPALPPINGPVLAPTAAPATGSSASAEVWATLQENNPVIIESNNFVPGTIKLKPEAGLLLDEVAGFANKYPEANLELTGYSDSTTNPALALGLADSVSNYLVKKGVAGNRITIKGEASVNSAGDKNAKELRAKNRRVEIRSITREEDKGLVAIPAPEATPATEPVPASVPIPAPTSVTVPESWNILLEKKKPVLVNIEGTSFESGSGSPSAKVAGELDEVVGFAGKYPEARLELTGYADSTGSAELNKKLSLDRAESVKKYLVSKGISAGRITTKGGGSANPVGSNRSKDGRAKNRRVEIHTID